MKRPSEKKRKKIVDSVINFAEACEEETSLIRRKWRDNHQMFEHGTVFEDKEDWQANFSINKLSSSIRAAQARVRRTVLNNPDWFDQDPVNPDDPRAAQLAGPFKKLLRHYLEAGRFHRYASTFILQSLISLGVMYVGWKPRRVKNPAYVAEKARQMLSEENKELASSGKFEVSEDMPDISEEEIQRKIEAAIDGLEADLQGGPGVREEKPKPWLTIGGLDFQIPISENVGWDTNVSYLENSSICYYRTSMRIHELRQYADMGRFNKKSVEALISEANEKRSQSSIIDRAYRHKTTSSRKWDSNEVELLVYFGPLVVDGKVEEEDVFAIIGNDTHLLAYGDYPFWEPGEHKGPLVMAAAREIPHKSVGAGIGDTAAPLQRTLDSNYTLLFDNMRFGVLGINIIDGNSIVEDTLFEEGFEPGMFLNVRGKPKEVFHHVDLTSNIENQVTPIQMAISQGIDDLTGVPALMSGGNNLRSRTTAAEVQARQGAGEGQVDNVSLDIEQQFLIPVLEKAFARVLQFGLSDIRTNPEIQNVLSEEEIELLGSLREEEKTSMLYNYYKFKIKGFSHQDDKAERIKRINEAFQVGAQGPLAEIIPWSGLLKRWFMEMDMPELSESVNLNSDVVRLEAENQLLMANQQVEALPDQPHERHLQSHQRATMSAQPTPAMQSHIQQHQQLLQQQQAQERMQQQMQAKQEAAQVEAQVQQQQMQGPGPQQMMPQ